MSCVVRRAEDDELVSGGHGRGVFYKVKKSFIFDLQDAIVDVTKQTLVWRRTLFISSDPRTHQVSNGFTFSVRENQGGSRSYYVTYGVNFRIHEVATISETFFESSHVLNGLVLISPREVVVTTSDVARASVEEHRVVISYLCRASLTFQAADVTSLSTNETVFRTAVNRKDRVRQAICLCVLFKIPFAIVKSYRHTGEKQVAIVVLRH